MGRPTFGQANQQMSLFKMVEGGRFAERVTVRLGASSVNDVEVRDGLRPGDIVILSDMSQWDGFRPGEAKGVARSTTMTNHALIRLDGVGKVFLAEEVETHALSNINLSIRSGEYVSIAGPSGCGKTTLLSILGLLDSPTSGRYLLDGTSAENLDAGLRARVRNQAIGFIFQAFNLIGDLTVYENVELPLTYRGNGGRGTKGARAGITRASGACSPHAALPESVVGRPAAACRGRAGDRRQAAHPAGG